MDKIILENNEVLQSAIPFLQFPFFAFLFMKKLAAICFEHHFVKLPCMKLFQTNQLPQTSKQLTKKIVKLIKMLIQTPLLKCKLPNQKSQWIVGVGLNI